uniref:RRM domain-containing protein n=1 Tax=Ulva partita TaxID=1605170 RepID=A0A1C9ZPQ7_9CHLO|nr:hypothetical protein [Ulva partita]BAV58279.1 hypothetical protein [Ulva partita]
MIDRKTGRSRGFGFVFLNENASTQDAINNMHGAIVDGRKISVTRAVPETQTMPGTPAPLLAAGKGIRSVRGVRGSAWDSDRHSPLSASRSRSTRHDRGGRYSKSGFAGFTRKRGRSPIDRSFSAHGTARDRSRSWSADRDSRGSSDDSYGAGGREAREKVFPPYEDARSLLMTIATYDDSGFDEYMSKCTALDLSGHEHHDEPHDSTVWRKEHSRRLSPERQDRPPSWPKHVDGPPTGFGGMRGASSSGRESVPNLRGRPERYSRDLR